MFGKAKPAAPKMQTIVKADGIEIGKAVFGEEELEVRELHLKGLRIPNPGEGNIISGQQFHFTLTLGEGESAPAFKVTAIAITATNTEVIGRFTGLDDEEKRLIALHMKATRAQMDAKKK